MSIEKKLGLGHRRDVFIGELLLTHCIDRYLVLVAPMVDALNK